MGLGTDCPGGADTDRSSFCSVSFDLSSEMQICGWSRLEPVRHQGSWRGGGLAGRGGAGGEQHRLRCWNREHRWLGHPMGHYGLLTSRVLTYDKIIHLGLVSASIISNLVLQN